MTQTLQTFKKLIAYWSIALLLVSLVGIFLTVFAWFGIAIALYQLLNGCTDIVRTCGPVYWIGRHDLRRFSIGLGTMHQVSAPWKKGRGVYIALFRYSLQIGLCHSQKLNEIDGTLSAIQGRYLDIEPKEIGNW
jgi:hypothetical protein